MGTEVKPVGSTAAGQKAWDADSFGYDNTDFHHIDPDTVNMADFARQLEGEELFFGDVRQYNSGYNDKHPENNVDLDWLGRVGTVFSTNAPGFEGIWHVSNLPAVRAPIVFCRAVKLENADDSPEGLEEIEISCAALGCAVNEDNLYEQIETKIVKRGRVDKKQRARLTKRK